MKDFSDSSNSGGSTVNKIEGEEFSQSDFPEGDSFVRISRNSLFGGVLALLLIAFSTIGVILNLDFETYFGADRLAMKVGGTVISLEQLKSLKQLAGPQAAEMSDQTFTTELVDAILLAEAGRALKLDRNTEYREKVAIFDKAVPPASDPQNLTRALFLINELAGLTRNHIMQELELKSPESTDETIATTPAIVAEEKLHVRTILVKDPGAASEILLSAASGSTFAALSASWSVSPYAGVGGDIGWIGAQELPQGVFPMLAKAPLGSITLGFSDMEGIHLFQVVGHPETKSKIVDLAVKTRKTQKLYRREIRDYLKKQRQIIPEWINPSLGNSAANRQ